MANPNPDTSGLRPATLGNRQAQKDRTMSARDAFRLYPEEKELICQAVKASGVKKNEWIRSVLLDAAKKQINH